MSGWNQFSKKSSASGEYWLTVSDLMAALMVIFLFVSIAFMERVTRIVVAWDKTQEVIFEELSHNLMDRIEEWNAEFDQRNLTIRFKDPDTLFKQGHSTLSPKFEGYLTDFCPLYFEVADQFVDKIEEIRIEGHTSLEWNHDTPENDAFFHNMRLSQSRTRAVMMFCLSLPEAQQYSWLKSKIRAVGMSSSQFYRGQVDKVDESSARRVEFRIKTEADQVMAELMQGLKG